MLYVSSKISDRVYAVTDTKDNITENVDIKDILDVVDCGKPIGGVSSRGIKPIPNAGQEFAKFLFLTKDIDKYDFYGTALTLYTGDSEEVVLPEIINKLCACCFKRCDNLKSITIKGALEELPSSCFSSCKALRKVVLPDTLEAIGETCFEYSGIRTLEIPDNVTAIDSFCFMGCTNLRRIKLPAKLKYLGGHCFYNCTQLKEITLPDTLTRMGLNIFQGCKRLEVVNVYSEHVEKLLRTTGYKGDVAYVLHKWKGY